MESGRSHGGVMRGGPGGKKMRKRKELDALVGGVGAKRANGGGVKRAGSGGVSPQDQLLSESTGEEDYWSSAKGGAAPKRKIHYSSSTGKSRIRACTALLRLCTILLVMACVVATITVMWLFIDIKEQTTYLRSQLDQVTAGNEAIPDAIQKCHNVTKQLEQNQTRIIIELQQVVQKLTDFSGMIQDIESGLSNVKKQLNGSPALSYDLVNSVANIGGQLTDFNITAMKVSNEQRKISEQLDTIKQNLTFYKLLEAEIQDWKNSSHSIKQSEQNINETVIQSILDHITPNISILNTTMLKKFDNVLVNQSRTQDTINDLKSSIQSHEEKLERLDLQDKVLNQTREETAQLQSDVFECKKELKNNEELLTNLTQQVISCTCLGERNATKDLPPLPTAPGTISTTRNP